MAKTLAAFPADDESRRRIRYPWGKWFDGQVWELNKGTEAEVAAGEADFFVATKSFASAIGQAAKVREGDARLAYRNDKATVVVQFIKADKTDEPEGEPNE